MNAEPIQALLRRQPFSPFEVHLANGEIYQVRHPENAVVLKSNLFLFYPDKDSFVIAAMAQVSNVQPLQPV